MQGLGNRLQVQVLDTPHLQPGLLSCSRKLLMGNHDGSERERDRDEMKEEGGTEGVGEKAGSGF